MAAMQMSFASATSGGNLTSHSPTPSLPLQTLATKSSLPCRKNPNFPSVRSLLFPTRTRRRATIVASSMAPPSYGDSDGVVLPPALDSTSEPPPIFDGITRTLEEHIPKLALDYDNSKSSPIWSMCDTSRIGTSSMDCKSVTDFGLYISYTCPYAQRAWITRNCKGLQEHIKLVPINLKNRPSWYKEKVYPANKVPSLEHNNEVRGESLDLIKYIDSHFEGPSLFPNDPAKKVFANVLFSYTDSFQKSITASFREQHVTAETDAALDFMEDALSKFSDGPFFLGQFSLVDIAYMPFFERYVHFLLKVKNYDLTAGRPKIAKWIQEMNKVEGYKETQMDPDVLIESYKKNFLPKV